MAEWSDRETLELFDLCRVWQLRFPVICDRLGETFETIDYSKKENRKKYNNSIRYIEECR
jgi:hypothetical protein